MSVHWYMNKGLMAKEPSCLMCAGEMSLMRCEDRSDGLKWECRKQVRGKKHRAEVSIRKGSWFDNSKMTLEEILKSTYWWSQDLDQTQVKHKLGLAESTGVDWDCFCCEVCKITLLQNGEKLGGNGKSYRLTKANLARGNTTVVITLKVSGSLEESSKTAGNVFWWQWKNGANKHYCPSSKNGLSLELLLFLIAGKRTPNLRHMVMNTELLIIQENL